MSDTKGGLHMLAESLRHQLGDLNGEETTVCVYINGELHNVKRAEMAGETFVLFVEPWPRANPSGSVDR